MTRHDSRAQRFVTRWGPSLAAVVGIASTVELAAMPFPATEAPLPHPILIQQSTEPDAQQPAGTPSAPSNPSKPDSFTELQEALTAARGRLEELSRAAEAVAATGQLQQELAALQAENQKLRAEIEATRTERGELATAKQAAEARTAELTKTVEQATAKAREVDQELVAVRWQNAQLNTSLAQARTSGDQIEAEARATQTALKKRLEELEGAAEQTSAETARLRKQMGASEQRSAAADKAVSEADARLSELRASLQRAEQEKTSVGADLARVQGELASAKEQAGHARVEADQRAAALEHERDELRTRLADLGAELRRSETTKAQLESEVAELREAAGAATDAARENLIAVENQIRELNEALGAIGPGGGPLETDPALLAESGAPPERNQADGGGRAAAVPVENAAPAATPSQGAQPGTADADLQRIKTASVTHPDDGEGAPMVADLPLEKRLHVQGLLADLHSNLDQRGLTTTVPGELLFAMDTDEVQPGAYDTLAKVAELIGTYDDRKVLIIGHSDAMGDAAYNRQLSERRAELVKQFFIDNFELSADRLVTEGLGEARPIASNTTPEGRRANRRVDVLILN
jgi:outer membrane protein OmpA-like peptidoglycan-associated protein/predicted  nucleic acid-binding Zn-ribbon protein